MPSPRVLVAGIGNIFFGDDAFGCEVARQLSARRLPAGVRVVDFGIRGLDLAYALLEDYAGAVLIDVTQRGELPGTLYVLEPDRTEPVGAEAAFEPHALHLAKVLHLARSMGEVCGWLRVVGCEPATFGTEEEPVMGLSKPVAAAVSEAIRLVEELLREVPARGG